VAYAAVLIWALIGIRNAYPDVAVVANTALGAAVVIALLAALGYWRTQRQAGEQPRIA
jgi:chromate transport protein ChrA